MFLSSLTSKSERCYTLHEETKKRQIQMRAVLTDRYIQSLKSGSNYTVWDMTFPSFGVRIGKHRKTFTVMTGKERRRITVGLYPKLSLQEARKKARTILDEPTDVTPTFEAALRSFDQLHLVPNTKPSSAKAFYRWLDHYIAPTIATKHLADISPRDLTTIFNALKDTPSQANNAYTAAKLFFNWCVAQHLLRSSPLQNIRTPFKTSSRERLLTDDEICAIWHASYNHNSFGNIIRSLILSGQRLNQIARFDHAWAQHDRLTFPAHIMKTNEQHTIPLTPILASHLPPSSSQRHANFGNAMKKFREGLVLSNPSQAAPISHFTLHDFRRYFSSTMAKLQVPIDVTEALLSHTTGSRNAIQRTYDRYDRLEPMRLALLKYETHVLSVARPD